MATPMLLLGCGSRPVAAGNAAPPSVGAKQHRGPTITAPDSSVAPNTTAEGEPTTEPGDLGSASPLPAIERYLAAREGTVTVGIYDRTTKQTWLLHPDLREDTASIVKLQIMGVELHDAESTGLPLTPEDQILTQEMIEASDNSAATALWDQDGGAPAITAFDRSIGLEATDPSPVTYIPGTSLPGWGLTTTSAADQLALLKLYAYPNSVLDSAERDYALELMRNIEAGQNWGVTAGVPVGVPVALKNGWLPLAGQGWQIDSVGWVHGDRHDYLLAVLDAGSPDEAYGIATIDGISSLVYAALVGNVN